MTTTVRVQARAWGATVVTSRATEGEEGHNVAEETVELGAHQDRNFQVEEGETITFRVTHGEQPQDRANELMDEEVPGRAQNDRLHPPVGNESGATETAQTTDGAGEQPAAVTGRGRRSAAPADEG